MLFAQRCLASRSLEMIGVEFRKAMKEKSYAYVKPMTLVTLNMSARMTMGMKLGWGVEGLYTGSYFGRQRTRILVLGGRR
jgi:hypothetical protein